MAKELVNVRRCVVMAAVLVAGCNALDSVQTPPAPSKLTLQLLGPGATSPKTAALAFGDTTRLSYRLTDVFGNATVASRPSFFSRDIFVATVSASGLIRAVGPGRTYVLALVQGQGNATLADSVSITVTQVCTLEARAGITIAVEDSVSGSTGPFASVSYVAREGTYRDSLLVNTVVPPSGQTSFHVGLAYERTGIYNVTVTANGYRPWTQNAVAVAKDSCHVIPVSLTARLVPAPP